MEIVTLSINEIYPSPTNPRKFFNTKELQELAESIKSVGIQQMIKVRHNPGKEGNYEIVFGERRFKAAKLAGLKEIEVMLERNMADEQLIEIQTIENLMRADVHPLDEADGFKSLMTSQKYTVEQIAAKFKKSIDYIYKRIKLADLTPEVKKAMYEDNFPVNYGFILCGYAPEIQNAIIKDLKNDISSKKLISDKLPSVASFKERLTRHYNFKLNDYKFDYEDTSLNPQNQIACSVCPKNIKNENILFGVSNESICTNAICLNKKLIGHIQAVKKANPKYKLIADIWYHDNIEKEIVKTFGAKNILLDNQFKKSKPGCKSEVKGIIVKGNIHNKTFAGEVIKICQDSSCKVCNYISSSSGSSVTSADRKKANDYNAERKIRIQELNASRGEIIYKVASQYINKTGSFQKDIIISAIQVSRFYYIDFYEYTILKDLKALPQDIKEPKQEKYSSVAIEIKQFQKMSLSQLHIYFLVKYLTEFHMTGWQDYERHKSNLGSVKDRLKFYSDIYLDKKTVSDITKKHLIPREDKKKKTTTKNKKK